MIDIDNNAGQGDMIGEVEVKMGSLMGAKNQTWTANLAHGNNSNRG